MKKFKIYIQANKSSQGHPITGQCPRFELIRSTYALLRSASNALSSAHRQLGQLGQLEHGRSQ